MGGSTSILRRKKKYSDNPSYFISEDDNITDNNKAWHLIDDTSVRPVTLDPTLPPLEDSDHIQLYQLLHEPVAQKILGKQAETFGHEYLLMCWVEVEEFKHENSDTIRLARGVELFDHYINSTSKRVCLSYFLKTIPIDEVKRYDALLATHTSTGTPISKNAFAEVTK